MMWIEFGEHYRISEAGVVQSRARGDWKPKKLSKKKTDQYGGYYVCVKIRHDWKRVHLLVWEKFKGPRNPGMVIDHIDRNRMNNHINNLREVSVAENYKNRNVRRKDDNGGTDQPGLSRVSEDSRERDGIQADTEGDSGSGCDLLTLQGGVSDGELDRPEEERILAG